MSIIADFTEEQMNAQFAKELEQVLISAASDGKWGSCRSAAKGFAKDQIYPLYKKHVVWSNTDIQKYLVKVYEPEAPKEG